MRFYQHFRASIARPALAAAAAFVFASGMAVSASGQARQGQVPVAPLPQEPASVANGTPLSMDEAVRMALENNLGVQAERLNPEIQTFAFARANAAYVPNLISQFSRGSSATPPTDFLSAGVAVVTSGSLFTQGGVQQQMRWGGGSYQVTLDGSRGTSDAPRTTYPLSLRSNLSAGINQPLLRNFKIDSLRLNLRQTRIQQSITDLQLTQHVTQTARNVRAAYYNLVGAISGLQVAQQSLDLSRESLKNNRTRVEVGTMAPIDIVSAEAEVASNEEAVIIQEAAIQSAEDQLRTLIMNPSQPGFWNSVFKPVDEPTMVPKAIDVDGAVKHALQNRTDILQLKQQIASTEVSLKYAENQKLPGVDLQARYGATGVGGTQYQYDNVAIAGGAPPIPTSTSVRSFGDVLRDVFGNNFRTWSVLVNVSYPIGTSPADALAAQSRVQRKQEDTNLTELEMNVTSAVRDAARQVNTNLKRVEATRKARDLAQQRLDAENKRFTVGLSSTFELVQAQRDLASAKQRELLATIDYNVSLVNFEAIQIAPVNGR
ncbi:MAG TPA: TolC family protein [Vicinamibacterales bacterium]|nr:TolC family protein [Vicinamibacterales bacterium]